MPDDDYVRATQEEERGLLEAQHRALEIATECSCRLEEIAEGRRRKPRPALVPDPAR
jgi:hypothetical protein